MKVKITLLVLSIIAAFLVGVSYRDYHDNRVAVKSAQQTLQGANAAVKEAQASNDAVIAKYNALWAECQKGAYDYGILPAASKNVKYAPNCGLSIVQ